MVAVVGLSLTPTGPATGWPNTFRSMAIASCRSIPAARRFWGKSVTPALRDIPFPVEIVDIFRKVEAIPGIVDDAIAVGAKVVWMQQGLEEPRLARRARQAGLRVVMDRCLKIEHGQRHL